jgi:hypothetical protein
LPWPADHSESFQADAHIAAHGTGLRGEWHLVAARAQHRPFVLRAEEPVGGALHMLHVFGMRADAAENAEHRLDEEAAA